MSNDGINEETSENDSDSSNVDVGDSFFSGDPFLMNNMKYKSSKTLKEVMQNILDTTGSLKPELISLRP